MRAARIATRFSSKSSTQPEDALPLLREVGVVELAVPRMQLDGEHLLLLGRQVGGDHLLGAAEQERPDPLLEPPQGGLVAVLLDGAGDVLG